MSLLILIGCGLLAYRNSFLGPFIFDDLDSIPLNPRIRSLWPIGGAMSTPGHAAIGGRPIVSLSLAINYALGGLDVFGFHAVNVSLHLVSACLLFGIVRRTLARLRPRPLEDAAASWLALTVALLWTVHPLLTKSVTYIIQRTELMMGFFFLLTLYCVIRAAGSARWRAWSAGAIASCLLGMGSKQVMVSAPVVVWLYDRIFLARSVRETFRLRGHLYAGFLLGWGVLAGLMSRFPLVETAGFELESLTPWRYALTQCGAILHYLRLAYWPTPLVLDYSDWPIASALGEIWPQALVVGSLLAATVWAVLRRPALGFLGAWFWLILLPTSSVVPIMDVVVEHRMYLPLAAVIAWTVLAGWRVLSRGIPHARWRQAVALGLVIAGAGLLMSMAVRRNADYRSAVSIWRDTVMKRPRNARAHNSLGVSLEHEGRLDEAVTEYTEAVRLDPGALRPHNNLGVISMRQGKIEEAIRHYHTALGINPDFAETRYNLGNAFLEQGRLAEAVEQFAQAVRLRPDFAPAENNWGIALLKQGRPAEARAHFARAVELDKDFLQAQQNLRLLRAPGVDREPAQRPQGAPGRDPFNAQRQNDLGARLAEGGRPQEAIPHFLEAIRLDPEYAEAQNNLGLALADQGQYGQAIQYFRRALEINPAYSKAKKNLADAVALERQALLSGEGQPAAASQGGR